MIDVTTDAERTVLATLTDLAAALTTADGRAWAPAEPVFGHGGGLACEDGAALFVRVGGHGVGEGRVGVTVSYPADTHKHVYPDPVRPKATASLHRGTGSVARRIARTILPVYRPELARVTAALDAHTEAVTARDRVAATLAAVARKAADAVKDGEFRLSPRDADYFGDVEVSTSGCVHLDIRRLTAEQATAMLRALAGATS
jgi:hypothetical protein